MFLSSAAIEIYALKGNAKECIKNKQKISKKLLTKLIYYAKIIFVSAERWLSWSKAHDWKSCIG